MAEVQHRTNKEGPTRGHPGRGVMRGADRERIILAGLGQAGRATAEDTGLQDGADGFRDMSGRDRVRCVLAAVLLSLAFGVILDLVQGDDLDWGTYVVRALGVATGTALLVFVVARRR